jgi:D-psicose/D-tagatose/L-ribulose 3-epimerase
MEPLSVSLERLAKNDISYIELHGNHYGPDLGYRLQPTRQLLNDWGIKVAGVCGMFSSHNDLSSNVAVVRQRAVDYLKREIEFTAAVGGTYLLVVPAAVGRPMKYDDMEVDRSIETLLLVADLFVEYGVKGAIEPIRTVETSIIHNYNEAVKYLQQLDHPGIQHISGDVYHMQAEEDHIGYTILTHGDRLINLHMADSNRNALGSGFMDLDTIIRALYAIDYTQPGHFVTPEPLGPGGDPYPAMYGKPDPKVLDQMVAQSVQYFREREAVLRQNLQK